MPPIPGGAAATWLTRTLSPGAWLLDPFGSSPALGFEAARAGYRVLAAVNNPILRFIFEITAHPPHADDFRLALAELSSSSKAGERLEPHLRSLYLTHCAGCGADVDAQAFIWDKGASAPSAKIYSCSYCKDSGEHPTTSLDIDRAARAAGGPLHRARALERVAPLEDPDRSFVIEAIETYPPRAVYALFTLVNKLESFPPHLKRALEALLLYAFDGASALSPFPSVRNRPKLLTIPTRYQERNVWLLLEEAAAAWPAEFGESSKQPTLTAWPELPPPEGGICLYEGRLRDLAASVTAAGGTPEDPSNETHFEEGSYEAGGLPFVASAALTCLPRPNQAFWTLSALWSGWLWGPESSAAIKSVLRRRRYDWDWHAEAMRANLIHLSALLPEDAPAFAILSEAEPGFVAAALTAAARSNFELDGMAIRSDDGQAQIHFKRRSSRLHPKIDTSLPAAVRSAAADYLSRRGEPAAFTDLHAAVLVDLVRKQILIDRSAEGSDRYIEKLNQAFELALSHGKDFERFGGTSRLLEGGLWWLADNRQDEQEDEMPLADRVEVELVRMILKNPGRTLDHLDEAICKLFPGALTPARGLVETCISSYCISNASGPGWVLRSEDEPASRRADLDQIIELLADAGRRLGYRVTRSDKSGLAPADRPTVRWHSDVRGYVFKVIASAVIGRLLIDEIPSGPDQTIIAIPGSRAALVEYKIARDPRLAQALQTKFRLLKFRHLRRLAEDPLLTRANFEAQLELDPLENNDPQMTLL